MLQIFFAPTQPGKDSESDGGESNKENQKSQPRPQQSSKPASEPETHLPAAEAVIRSVLS